MAFLLANTCPLKNGFLLKNKTSRKPKKTKSSDPWTWSEERLDRGHGSELLLFWVILVLPWFLQFGQNHEKTKKQKNRPMDRVWGEAWQGTWV